MPKGIVVKGAYKEYAQAGGLSLLKKELRYASTDSVFEHRKMVDGSTDSSSKLDARFQIWNQKTKRMSAVKSTISPKHTNIPAVGECNCGGTYASERDLKEHLRESHGLNPVFSTRNSSFSFPLRNSSAAGVTCAMALDQIQVFHCPYCPKFYAFKYLLNTHIVNTHYPEWDRSNQNFVVYPLSGFRFPAKVTIPDLNSLSSENKISKKHAPCENPLAQDLTSVKPPEHLVSHATFVDLD